MRDRSRSRLRRLAGAAGLAALSVSLSPSPACAVGSVSTAAVRPLGMGGAFVAVEDQISAVAWNPGAFSPPECRAAGGIRLHLNVLGAPAVARETGLLAGRETEEFARLPAPERFGIAVGSVVKSAAFRRGGFACGALLLEEHLDPSGLSESKGLADAGDILDGYYSVFCVTFRLGSTVSIGASETIYAGLDENGERRFGVGRSYGALLKPNRNVSVGLVYFDSPPGFRRYRREIEGLAPRTMNAGIAYSPLDGVLLTLDLRDLAEKHVDTALQPRAGVEVNLWGKGALRAGFCREESDGENVLSVGVGAIPMAGCLAGGGQRRSDGFVLNYASLLSEAEGPRHLLSVVLHF